MQVKTTQGFFKMLYWDIFTVFKFYSTVGWPQCRITHHNLKKLDELSRTCDSAWPPFFRNIAPWYFSWHFYTNQDIAISKKKTCCANFWDSKTPQDVKIG